MFNLELFSRMANSLLHGGPAELTSKLGLRKHDFVDAGRQITALEQNPSTGSRFAALVHSGHEVVQFKHGPNYVAVAIDGKVELY